MAIYRVWNAAAGLADGSSWTDAYVGFKTAWTAASDTDEIWIADDHFETSSATIDLTPARETAVYSVDRSDDSYSPATSVQLQLTGGGDWAIRGSIAMRWNARRMTCNRARGCGCSAPISNFLVSGTPKAPSPSASLANSKSPMQPGC